MQQWNSCFARYRGNLTGGYESYKSERAERRKKPRVPPRLMIKATVVAAAATVACALHSGQGERVGFHGVPESGPDEYASADLSPSDFWDKYVQGMEPVVIRGAVKADPAVELWTDDYMIREYGDMKVRVEPKIEGGSRSVEAGEMPSNLKLRDFYNKWFDEAYVVTQIPRPMANETTIASVMSCGPITDQFVEMNLWISKATSGVTSSQIHKDSNNQMVSSHFSGSLALQPCC